MDSKQIKIPDSDHPISIVANPFRGWRVSADLVESGLYCIDRRARGLIGLGEMHAGRCLAGSTTDFYLA
jgi:hypothetical protein